MYKVIELGVDVQETGERRVSLIDGSFAKTASSSIQTFWDELQRDPDKAYLWVIGVSAMEYYGCNNNGDAFTEADLKARHHTFVDNANVFLYHVNKDPKKAIGKPIHTYYNEVMHRVEIVMELYKGNPASADVIKKIKEGEPIFVSMGCHVEYDQCSICGNKSKHRGQYCEHLKYNLKKILPDGRQVFALNPNPKFFDISIVRRPADPTAFTLDKVASDPEDAPAMSSAELGEMVEAKVEKLAALNKLSELFKRIDGYIAEEKDEDGETNVLRQLARRGFKGIDYPALDVEKVVSSGANPVSFAKALISEGSPLTFGDALCMSGMHSFGREFRPHHIGRILAHIPRAMDMWSDTDVGFGSAIAQMLSSYTDTAPTPDVLNLVRPAAKTRVIMITKLASSEELSKIASAIPGVSGGELSNVPQQEIDRYTYMLSQQAPGNLRTVTSVGHDGKSYTTSYGEVRNSSLMQLPITTLKKTTAAALLAVALGAFITDPTKVKNLVTTIVSGALGMSLLNDKSPTLKTTEGHNIPMNAAFHKAASSQAVSPIVYAGMAVPAALGLDYMYNKWKYKGENPEAFLGRGGVVAHKAGNYVAENPVTAITAGGILGGTAKALLAKKFKV